MPAKMKNEKMLQRSEANQNISEFNLTEVGKEKIKLNDLLRSLKKSTGHQTIKQQLKHAVKEKKMDIPLSKPVADRIKRAIAYEKVSEEVGKWDSVVRSNRTAEQIVYPLKKPEFRLEAAEDYVQRFRTKNALEEEVSKLLNGSENALHQDRVFTVAEERTLQAMSLAEAKKRHGELRKARALLSYQEAKAKRQKKIKSKKYHRVLKKEKMKKLMKEFEELQKMDPEAAKEKLLEADKLRILERMTLKHKSTGKWAKQQKIRAKYNPDSRSALKEQMNIGKQLTDKVIPLDDLPEILQQDVDENPQDVEVEDGDLLDLYKFPSETAFNKPSKTIGVVKSILKEVKTKETIKLNSPADEDDNPMSLIDESCERLQTLEDFDSINDTVEAISESAVISSGKKSSGISAKPKGSKSKVGNKHISDIDFAQTSKVRTLDSKIPVEITGGEEGIDDEIEDENFLTMEEALADESLISEFREEKNALIEKERPEGIDLFLPGWGAWGGSGIIPSKRKRKRFFIKPTNVPERKDATLGNVIISEDKDTKAAVHQVSDLPFQYKSVHQFESAIRQPIGNTWNTETSFQKAIAPNIITKLGKIINPIDAEDVTLQDKKAEERKTFKKNVKMPKQHKGKGKSKRKVKTK